MRVSSVEGRTCSSGVGAMSLSGYWYEHVWRRGVEGGRRERTMEPYPGLEAEVENGLDISWLY